MSKEHRKYFNELSSQWDQLVQWDDDLESHIDAFGIDASDYVLDVGAGTGRLTTILQKKVQGSGAIVAVDIAEEMLKKGHGRFASTTIRIATDICHAGLKGNLFTKVICFSTFPHIINKRAALCEFYRLLKPNGKLLILHTKCSRELNSFHSSLQNIVRRDEIPPVEVLKVLGRSCGLVPIRSVERPDLYWAEFARTR